MKDVTGTCNILKRSRAAELGYLFGGFTMRAIRRIVSVKYVDEEGFSFTFEPVEDTLTVKKTETGFEAAYLSPDKDFEYDRPDDGLFLVHYHRDFWIERKNLISKDDLGSWYQGRKIEQEKSFWIFPVSALIHSGVWLQLGNCSFPADSRGWDTSHVGAVLVSKKEARLKKKAEAMAESLVDEWNKVLSGEVFAIVKETYDKDKNPIGHDEVWGFIGYEYAKQELAAF